MRRDRNRKNYHKDNYIKEAELRMEHSCFCDNRRIRPMYSDKLVRDTISWDEFIEKYLVDIQYFDNDIKDKVFHGCKAVFQFEDGQRIIADTRFRSLVLESNGTYTMLDKDLIWDINYIAVFKFSDVVGNHYQDGSGTL